MARMACMSRSSQLTVAVEPWQPWAACPAEIGYMVETRPYPDGSSVDMSVRRARACYLVGRNSPVGASGPFARHLERKLNQANTCRQVILHERDEGISVLFDEGAPGGRGWGGGRGELLEGAVVLAIRGRRLSEPAC